VAGPTHESPRLEPVDLRILAGFAAITLLLVLPAIVNLLTPADEQSLQDAASSLGTHGGEALAILDRRTRLTNAAYDGELEDIAAAVNETTGQLEREAIEPAAADLREHLTAVADDLSRAIDAASLDLGDDQQRAQDREQIAQLVAKLQSLAGGG
jgi:hypothetical protein